MSFLVLSTLFVCLLIPGIFLVFIPFVPAIPYMMLVAVIFKFTETSVISYQNLAILFGLTLLSIFVDWSAGLIGAKYGGAHTKSLIYGIIGSILGTLLFPPFGGIIGMFTAILIAEFSRKKDKTHAVTAAGSAVIGTVVGMVINFFIALVFFILFLTFVIF